MLFLSEKKKSRPKGFLRCRSGLRSFVTPALRVLPGYPRAIAFFTAVGVHCFPLGVSVTLLSSSAIR